jgi:hypothetical protein
MDITNVIAIDVHTHAHISNHISISEVPGDTEVREAARRYFKQEGSSPTLFQNRMITRHLQVVWNKFTKNTYP